MLRAPYCLNSPKFIADTRHSAEHYKREPNCPFFTLLNQYPPPKKGRAKGARVSRASRLSVQSVATVATHASDFPSTADLTIDQDDSVMTTASTMTQGGKKTARGRKTTATTARARKTKAKKEEPVEIYEDSEQVVETTAKGRKRPSDSMEDSALTNAEAPAQKKRVTRGRTSVAVDVSRMSLAAPDSEMSDILPVRQPAGRKKRSSTAAKGARKVSQQSDKSQLTTELSDDELERQLEADLDRYRSDVEEEVPVEKAPASTRGRPKKAATSRKTSQKTKVQADASNLPEHGAVVPAVEMGSAVQSQHAEIEPEQSAADGLAVPKKGRKAGTRKVSKATKKAKEAAPPPPEPAYQHADPTPELAPEALPDDLEQLSVGGDLADADVSTGTVITKAAPPPPLPPKRGRGRPSKRSTSSQPAVELPSAPQSAHVSPQPEPEPVIARSVQKRTSARLSSKRSSATAAAPIGSNVLATVAPAAPTPRRSSRTVSARASAAAIPSAAPSHHRLSIPAPATPDSQSTPSRRGANHTEAVAPVSHPPSAHSSPQASDAENYPPEPHSAVSVRTIASNNHNHTENANASTIAGKRSILAPVTTSAVGTPQSQRSSPVSSSKRSLVASGGLRSTIPWKGIDVEAVLFPSPQRHAYDGEEGQGYEDKENFDGEGIASRLPAMLLSKGAELTSPEKRMTVEEWIYHNASLAEQKLKQECEAMVSVFEKEGSRAMRVLESIVVTE